MRSRVGRLHTSDLYSIPQHFPPAGKLPITNKYFVLQRHFLPVLGQCLDHCFMFASSLILKSGWCADIRHYHHVILLSTFICQRKTINPVYAWHLGMNSSSKILNNHDSRGVFRVSPTIIIKNICA